ncbi:MAG TPA: protein kinase [Terriglobales bacterium]|jgi:serine/threonine-protein kinase|nr:protein kinase [Terriglobales bacterium]
MTDEIKRIGDYQILDELGSGGMGRVWRVRNVISDRIEAMKVLLPDLAGRQELAARFLREIKLMASLNHPNIAQLRTAFTADNQLYMVMEYVEGTTVAAKLEHGAIAVPDALNYIRQVLDAVSYAHKQNVIHRDIKPANMMLTPQGVIKLMDFGIARGGEDRSLTMTGTTMGSLSYMSPEQVKGEPTDARSDLYSVGVSLYEMVTGQRPFVATSDYSIMAAHVKESPKPPADLHPGLPAVLNEIILMAIAKDPAQRFQTADAFRNALSSVPATDSPAVPQSVLDASTVTSMQTPVTQQPTAPLASKPPVTPTAPPQAAKAPVPTSTPVPMPPPAQGGGHRGLYMTLGALIVLAVLVVAGIYVPRSSWTHAKSPDAGATPATADNSASQAPSDQAAPNQNSSNQAQSGQGSSNSDMAPAAGTQPSPAATGDAAAGTMNSNSASPTAAPSAAASADNSNSMQPQQMAPAAAMAKSNATHHAKKLMAQNNPPNGTAGDIPGGTQSGAAGGADNLAQMDELEKTIDQLSNRAAAVNSGLDRLQQQQAASGYGLRSDMVERQASLKSNLYKAEEALQHRDVTRAKKYADLAEADAGVLERFLGH